MKKKPHGPHPSLSTISCLSKLQFHSDRFTSSTTLQFYCNYNNIVINAFHSNARATTCACLFAVKGFRDHDLKMHCGYNQARSKTGSSIC